MLGSRDETGRERSASRGIGLRIAPRFVVAIMIPLTLVLVVFSWWMDFWDVVVQLLVHLTLVATLGSGITYCLRTRDILREVDA